MLKMILNRFMQLLCFFDVIVSISAVFMIL
jgi:hypothetical protein